ncbi:MAG: hypothetical protein ACFFAO_09920 [Candidatus Hermodarchaeota archaeon]
MAFCGNVVELVEKHKIYDDKEEFIEWTEFKDQSNVKVFIENNILPELLEKDFILIDVAVGEVDGNKVGLFFIKKREDVYG